MGTPSSLIDLLQDGPKSAPKAPKSAPRAPQERPKRPQEAPKKAPKGSQETPKRPKRPPRGLQEAPKSEKARNQKTLILPRCWKDFGLLGRPRGDSRHSRGAALIGEPPFFDRSPPRWPPERLEGSQERPKSAPREPQEAPRGPHEASKRLPRDPQEATRGPPRYARRLQERKGEKAKNSDFPFGFGRSLASVGAQEAIRGTLEGQG